MKGLYVINSLEGGGAERVFSNLLEILSETDGYDDLSVVLLDKYRAAYVMPSKVASYQLMGPKPRFKNFFSFLKIVKDEKPEYVVSFLTRANFFNIVGSYMYGYKSIISERSNTDGRFGKRFYKIKKMLTGYIYRKADKIVAVSKGVESCLVNNYGVNPSKVVCLHNPVNVALIENIANKVNVGIAKPYIIAMGRLVKSKCFDILIDSYAKSNIDEELRILGEGPELDYLKSKVRKLNLEHKVHFMGFQENPYSYIKNAEFFVLPSSLEGFPNALVEAMALSKAVISTNCTDGPSEILNLEKAILNSDFVITEYGLMVNVCDCEGLSKALKLLSKDKKINKILSLKAYERVQKYSPENFRNSFIEIINDTTKNQ